MQKTFVLDTNVLIHDPESIFAFEDNKVVIPMTVIEELDELKRSPEERGRNVRSVIRKLNDLRSRGKLTDGVKLDSGGTLKIELETKNDVCYDFATSKMDHRIIGVSLTLQKKGERVFLITKDINLRIKSEAIGLETQDYENAKIQVDKLYTGWSEVQMTSDKIDLFYKQKELKVEEVYHPNEGVVMKDIAGSSKSAMAKYSAQKKALIPLFHLNASPWGLKPLNMEQRFAMELLLCEDVNLVTLVGVPGAGKTLLSLACALHKTIEENCYRRLLIARPIVPMGRDIGFLPGSKEEKLNSWMGAIYDNLEYLLEHSHGGNAAKDGESAIDYLMQSGKIEIEALTFLRGRTLPQQFIIIDDSQNLTPHEIKTIISRAGQGSKIVLTGDPFQIDNPYLDVSSNGLTYLVEHFKGQNVFGHLSFAKSERSPLAALASELL